MAIQREYLSPNEIAELLGVSPFTIRRYIKVGQLRAVKLLGGFRIHREELQRFLKEHEVNPAGEAPEPGEIEPPASPEPQPATVTQEPDAGSRPNRRRKPSPPPPSHSKPAPPRPQLKAHTARKRPRRPRGRSTSDQKS